MQFFIFFKRLFNKVLFIFKVISKFLVSKKVLKTSFCCIVLIFLVFSPALIFNKGNYQLNLNKHLNLNNNKKTVLNLWHIENFEGGTNNRGKYLEKQAIKFNKINNNCFINVESMTEEQLYLNLKENKYPDLFSFGTGVGYMISGILSSLEENNLIRDDLKIYGQISEETMAYPFLLSGYCAITKETYNQESGNLKDREFNNVIKNKKEIKGIGFSQTGVSNISQVLLKNEITNIKNENVYSCNSTYDAYSNFLSNKFVTLIGTARDVARCKNRENNGNLSSCTYNFLGGYSDLIQYIGVCKQSSQEKINLSKKFAKFLTTDNCQKDIKFYGLFSTTGMKIYDSGYMLEFENCLNKGLSSISAFADSKLIENQKKISFNKLFKNN